MKILPRLRNITYKNKKHRYHIKDSAKKRRKAIDEGVKKEQKKTKRNKRESAAAKKARFNVLRIYRRYKNPKECEILTKDMKYMDKKYKLGKTKNICKKNKNSKNTKKMKGGNKLENLDNITKLKEILNNFFIKTNEKIINLDVQLDGKIEDLKTRINRLEIGVQGLQSLNKHGKQKINELFEQAINAEKYSIKDRRPTDKLTKIRETEGHGYGGG